MQSTKLFDFDVIDSGPTDAVTTVLLLHGYGADNRDLMPLAEELDALSATTRWIFANGPLQVPIGPHMHGRAWFKLDARELEMAMLTGQPKDYSHSLPENLEVMSRKLAHLMTSLIKPQRRLIVGGFSQGAMMACDAVFTHQLPVHSLVILSGALVAAERWKKALNEWSQRTQVRVFQSHGEWDPILAFANATALHDLLTHCGMYVDFHAFRGQHEIPRTVIKRLNEFLA